MGILNTLIASEIIARQAGDNNLSTQLTSEMNTRASQDGNLLSLIQAGLRDGDALVFDTIPTQNSANHVTSGGIYSTLKDSNIGFVDEVPTAGSNNLVKSGGVYASMSKAYQCAVTSNLEANGIVKELYLPTISKTVIDDVYRVMVFKN